MICLYDIKCVQNTCMTLHILLYYTDVGDAYGAETHNTEHIETVTVVTRPFENESSKFTKPFCHSTDLSERLSVTVTIPFTFRYWSNGIEDYLDS